MPPASSMLSGPVLRDAVRLALARLDPWLAGGQPGWTATDAARVQAEAGRHLRRHRDAAVLLGPAAARLVAGIPLVLYLEPGGPFGPAWAGHPFASSGMRAAYRLREPDITRALAAFMGPGAGRRGAERAVSFLRVLLAQAGDSAVAETLTDHTRPLVLAEHPAGPPGRSAVPRSAEDPPAPAPATGRTRIDLLFEWPLGSGAQRAVVVIEVKLGAVLSAGQLLSYRTEARRRARGGPVALVLLTAAVDPDERRYRAWRPVRWPALLRRWEIALAAAGDADPEFARLRAHLWRFLLTRRGLSA